MLYSFGCWGLSKAPKMSLSFSHAPFMLRNHCPVLKYPLLFDLSGHLIIYCLKNMCKFWRRIRSITTQPLKRVNHTFFLLYLPFSRSMCSTIICISAVYIWKEPIDQYKTIRKKSRSQSESNSSSSSRLAACLLGSYKSRGKKFQAIEKRFRKLQISRENSWMPDWNHGS